MDQIVKNIWVKVDGVLWLMCDICRDQDKEWYVQALGTELAVREIIGAQLEHLGTHNLAEIS